MKTTHPPDTFPVKFSTTSDHWCQVVVHPSTRPLRKAIGEGRIKEVDYKDIESACVTNHVAGDSLIATIHLCQTHLMLSHICHETFHAAWHRAKVLGINNEDDFQEFLAYGQSELMAKIYQWMASRLGAGMPHNRSLMPLESILGVCSYRGSNSWGSAPYVKLELLNWVPQSHLFGSWVFCTYCGQTPDCSDHVIPFSMLSVCQEPSARKNYGLRTPSCRECNSILSDLFFESFQLRCQGLKARLEKRHKKRLNSPDWEMAELKKLKGSVQDYVSMRQKEKEVIRLRIKWQDTDTFKELMLESVAHAKEVYPNNSRLIEFLTFR